MDVRDLPGCNASAVFVTRSASIFKEQNDILPLSVSDRITIMPWGADNNLPFDIMNKIDSDETMSTCMEFNAEVLYGAGLTYDTGRASRPVADQVGDFFTHNDMSAYFMGIAKDFKFFNFAVSVIILSADHKKILYLRRKEACYCRFSPADASGKIRKVYYANWRISPLQDENIEEIELLDPNDPLGDLQDRIRSMGDKAPCKYAVVSRIPTVDSTYYPIPYYGSLFKGGWYDIKRLIAVAKESKLRNNAPIKYQIEISDEYWDRLAREEGLTNPEKQRERFLEQKQMFIDYLTGAENSGKVLFSGFYVNPDGTPCHDVVIKKIDSAVQGGDWATDIQEAVNMICFTLRVHSNLVGSVPGKSQTNNSGSDKRELYTIAQALQKPYRDILFGVHRLIICFNCWKGTVPFCPFVTLTTLDEHTDMKTVDFDSDSDHDKNSD